MKMLSSLLLVIGASFAQQITFTRPDGSRSFVDGLGECRGIGGPVKSVDIPGGLVVKFYSGWNCQGQETFAIRQQTFNQPLQVNSVRILRERGPTYLNSFYGYGNDDRYNQGHSQGYDQGYNQGHNQGYNQYPNYNDYQGSYRGYY